MSAGDPDIAALASRLGLRGLRYRSFEQVPAWAAARRARDAARVEDPPPAPSFDEPSAAPPVAVEVTPPPAARPPDAAPPAAEAPRAPARPAAAAPHFPLLGDALARASGRPAQDPLPQAARPFAALRLAVAGRGDATGH
ncbi:hypothetical protein GXW74_26720 [Roseomonas eburnea]|uniref:Uncharacterized protein n=1 Tax=Neoroseomonas eburnea TaxID=1346889 RepID=A0A9X9XK51_9PROT|nr:hypothetical protein [Neoroseomonas eburnea]MBR0684087.1 hypothetical protein [Neoroseomonas eburnea]